MAKFLSGTTANFGDNSSAAEAAYSNKDGHVLFTPLNRKTQELKNRINNKLDTWEQKAYGAARKGMANMHAKSLKAEALTSNASRDVVQKVESKYGISHKEAMNFSNPETQKKYSEQLLEDIKKTSPNGDHKKLEKLSQEIMKDLKNADSGEFNDILKQKLSSEMSEADIEKLMNTSNIKDMTISKEKSELFQRAYIEVYTELSAEKRERFKIRDRKKERAAKRAEMADRNVALGEELKRYMSGNLLRSEADEVQYSDNKFRTLSEQVADRSRYDSGKEYKKQLDALTVKHGKDIQRPDFLAKQKEMLKNTFDEAERANLQNDIANYDKIIKENLKYETRESLRSHTDSKGISTIKGDTYIRDHMPKAEFDTMIQDIRNYGKNLVDSDIYMRQKSIYANDPSAMEELDNRVSHINSAVEEEVQRLRDVRNSDASNKHSIVDDIKSDGTKAKDFMEKKSQAFAEKFSKKPK
jgi:hypothetical protein